MIYAFIAALAAGAASGFYAAWEIQSGKVLACEMAIERGNQNSKLALVVATEKVKQAELKADTFHKELEVSREQSLNVANDRWDRLHKSQRTTSDKNTLPNCESTGVSDETPRPDFLAGCTELLERADKNLRIWVDAAIKEFNNNCGIDNDMDR